LEAHIDLTHSPTLAAFAMDDSPVRILKGPVGSGKTTALCFDVMKIAGQQERSPKDGVRYSRWAIVRNTYGELKLTTIKTWLRCFPEETCGKLIYSAPAFHHIKIKGKLDLEVYFIALDNPKDVRKLLSLELSGVAFNEMREAQEEIVIRSWDRVGRYPAPHPDFHGVECSFPALIGDTNAPDEDHWIYHWEMNGIDFGDGKKAKFFNQPGAVKDVTDDPNPHENIIRAAGRQYILNPKAENVPNLMKGYYQSKLPLSDRPGIRVYYESKYGVIGHGQPVVPDYDDEKMSVEGLPVLPDQPLILGMDIGGGTLSPAVVIGQVSKQGIKLIHAELSLFNTGLTKFVLQLDQLIALRFPGRVIEIGWGDPAGNQRDPIEETIIFEHLKNHGYPMKAAPSNAIPVRIEATKAPMLRLIDGRPGFLVNKSCVRLRSGLAGKWVYKRKQVPGAAQYSDKPDKGIYSHICDAVGYFNLGTGEFQAIQGKEQRKKRLLPYTLPMKGYQY